MEKQPKATLLIYLVWLLVATGCAVGGDDLGFESSNEVDEDVIVPDLPIDSPTGMSLISPGSSPGFAVNPQVRVAGVTVGHTARLYNNANCTGTALGSAVVSSGTTVDVPISPDLSSAGSYRFYAQMEFGALRSSCTGNPTVGLSVLYVFDPNLGPAVTGIADDSNPTNNKVWLWGCNKASCNYRFAVNQNSTHSFTVEPYLATNTTTQSAGDGLYYIHVQPRDNGTLIEGFVQTYAVIMDNTAPTLPAVSVISDNINPAFARVGDTLTLTFSANESLGATPVVNINGSGATVNNLGSNNYSASYLYTGADADGPASFTIDFVDVAGNSGTQVVGTTDASSVTFDKVAPNLTPRSIASNNVNPAFAILGDVITLTFTSNETLGSLPTATINGSAHTVTDLGGNNYSVARTIDGTDPIGVVTYSINVEDQAGNTAGPFTTTTDATSVTVDNTVPTLSPVSISSNNADPTFARVGNIITISFTGSESLNNVSATIAGNAAVIAGGPVVWTATYTMTGGDAEGVIPFTIDFEDLAGNSGVQVSSSSDATSVTFDHTVPTLTAVTVSSNNANSSLGRVGNTFSLNFTASESLGALPTVTVDGNPVVAINIGGNDYLAPRVYVGGDTEGVTPFTIDFADPAGNAGAQVTSTTNASSVTFDETVPTLSPVSIASNNANPALAVVGDIITLSFTSSETLNGNPVVTIAGGAAVIGGGPLAWTATRTVAGGDPQGAAAFTIDFNDAAGNTGVQVTSVTDASSVTIDSTVPALSPVSIASNNANSSLAQVGDVITLSFTGSEGLQNVSATIDGNAAAIAGGPLAWTATYTMQAGDTEGALAFTIDFDDLAGNSGVQVTATTDASSVTFDESAPTATPVSIASNNANTALAQVGDVVTLSFTVSEALIGNPTVTIDGNAAVIAGGPLAWTATYTMQAGDTEGALGFTLDFTDASGNAGTQVTATTDASSVTFDETVPTASPVSIASNNANTALAQVGDVVTLSFTVSEALNGNPTVTIDGNAAAIAGGPLAWTATYTMQAGDTEGALGFTLDFSDASGNAGTQVTATTDASSVTFDETVPTATPVSIASNNANTALAQVGDVVTLSFTVSEALVGNPTVTIAGNAAAIAGGPLAWTATHTVTGADPSGNVAFTLDFTDSSGNAATQVTATTDASSVSIDLGPPSLSSVSIASDNANTALSRVGNVVTLSFTGSEPLQNVSATIDGNVAAIAGGPLAWTATYTMQAGDTEGALGFTIDYEDLASNAGTQVIATTDASSVTFDETVPTASPVSIASNNANTALAKVGDVVTLSFTTSEALNGNPTVTIDGNAAAIAGGPLAWTATYTIQAGDTEGILGFTLDFSDAAGNAGTQVTATTDASSVTFDETLPTATPVSIASNNANTSFAQVGDIVTLNFTVSEALIGNPTVTIDGNSAAIAGGPLAWTATYTMQAGDTEGALGFTLDFTDTSGNAATQVTATTDASSVTFDETVPTASPVSIASNNANTALAQVGDVVTLSFTTSEALNGNPTVTIDGNAAAIAGGPLAWTATYTMQAGDTEGALGFTLDFTDASGNAGTQVTATTDASSVTFDETVPTASPVSIASNNANTALAKVGDIVTLSFTTSEALNGNPTVTIDGNAAVIAGGPLAWTATYTMQAGDTEGALGFTLDFSDAAGNAGTQVTATTDATSVTFDETVPTATPVSIASNNANPALAVTGDIITLSFTTSENLLANPVVTIAGNAAAIAGGPLAWTATYTIVGGDPAGAVAFTLDFTDTSGNAATQVTGTTDASSVTIDNGAPTLGPVSIASNNANTALSRVGNVVTLSFTGSEPLQNVSATIDGNAAAIAGGPLAWTATYTMQAGDTEGALGFTIDYEDLASNAGTQVTATTDASSVTFDETVPTATPVSIASNNTNTALAKVGDIVTLSFTTSENLIANPVVTIDGNAAVIAGGPLAWTATYTMQAGDTEGALGFTLDFSDAAGNAGTQVTATTDASSVTFDETLPTATPVSVASNNANSSFAQVGDIVTLSFTVSEALIGNPTVTIDGNAAAIVGGPLAWTATYTMQAGDTEGALGFTLDFTDTSGNAATQVTATTDASSVTFDETVPTASPVSIASNNANTALAQVGDVVTLSFTTSEALNGNPVVTIDGNAAAIAGGPLAWTATYTMQAGDTEGALGFTLDFTDASGNAGTQVTVTTDASSVTFDETVPTATPVSIASNNANTALAQVGDVVTLSFTVSEALNGNPTVTIDGNAAAIAGGPLAWTATYTMQAGDTEGALGFTLDFTDASGNAGTQVTATTDASSVTFDETVPTATPVSIASNNANTALAQVGDVVTLSFTVSETLIANPTVTIDGNAAAIAGGPLAWTATYTMQAGDTEGALGFTLDFTDTSGNAATQVAATTDASSVTFDESAPTATPVSIASNNANSSFAQVGDVVTLSFTVSETLIANPTVTIDGNAAAIAGGPLAWTATYTMQAGDTEGALGFTLDFTDTSGNAGTQVTATTDASSVTFDETVPTATPVSIASNNANTALAKVGDVVTLSFTTSEALNGNPTVTIDGNAAVIAGGPLAWTATYTMQAGDTEGALGFTLDFSDAAGNAGTQVTATTDATSVTFDETVPTATPVSIASNNANTALAKVGDVVTLSFTVSEALNGNPVVTIDGNAAAIAGGPLAWTATYTMQAGDTEGALGFTLDFTDTSGNAATQVTATTDASSVTFDETLPTASPVSIASDNANPAIAIVSDTITLSFTTSENLIANPVVTIAGNAAAIAGGPLAWTATHTVTGADPVGAVAFTLDFTDTSGNAATQVTGTTDASSVTIDAGIPTLTSVSVASNNANTVLAKVGDVITLSFTGSENLQNVSATIAGNVAAIAGGPLAWTATYTMQVGDAEGIIPFTIDFEDLASNSGVQVTATTDASSVTFDKTLPTLTPVSVVSNNANTALAKVGDTITLTFTSSEALNALPVVTIAGNAVTETDLGSNNYSATYVMTGGDTEGVIPFTIDFVDSASNNGTQVTATTDASSITFDRTAPTASPVSIASNNANTSFAQVGDVVTLSFTVSEALIANPTVTIDGNAAAIAGGPLAWTATYTMQAGDTEGALGFTLDFTDTSGNAGTQATATTDASSVTFDETVPMASPVSIASNNANTALAQVGDVVTLSFTTSEALNGNPVVTIDGNAAAIAGGPLAWTATYTMQAGDTEGALGFTLDFTDTSGNAGTQVTVTTDASSVTFDETLPTATPISIASNNANTALAKVGDIVTLSFTTSEALNGNPTVTIDGNAAAIAGGPLAWTATYTMQAGDTEGALGFTLDFSDAAGNAGTQVTATTDASSVTFDETVPTASPVSIASNNANTALAQVGDVVTLSFTVSEALNGNPVVTIDGNAAAIAGGPLAWTATYTMQAGDTEGALGFTLDFTDTSGNAATQVTATTDASSVTFDESAPTATPVSIASNNANSSFAQVGDVVTLSFTVSETLIANPTVTIDGNAAAIAGGPLAWTATYTMQAGDTEGALGFTLDFTDTSGNAGTQVTATTDASSVTFDETVPTASPVSIASNNANTALAKVGDVVTLSFTTSEALNGNPTVTIDGNAAVIAGGPLAWTATYTMQAGDTEGALGFTLDFSDAAGNAGTQVTATTDASSVTFDETVPTATPVSIASNNANTALAKVGDVVTLSFTVSEALNGNPVVTIDGNAAAIAGGPLAWTATYTMQAGDTEGALGFTLDFSDAAGNAGTQVTATTDASSVTFDESDPTLSPVSLVSNNADTTLGVNGDTVTLTFTSSEALGALPVATIEGGGVTVNDLGSNNYSATYNVTGASADGAVTFTIDFVDPSGNNGTQVTTTTDATNVDIDHPPVVTGMSVSANSTYNLTQDIDFTVTYDKNVDIANTPRIQLTVGATTHYANYASGSGTQNIVFTYDTQAGDEDTDGIAFASTLIDLNTTGTVLSSLAGSAAALDFSAHAPNLSGVLVDAIIPTVAITSAPDINLGNQNAYTVTGSCSENGRIVNVFIGAVNATPTCSGGAWTTGAQNVSGEGDGTVNVTADHDDAAGNDAVQATASPNKDTTVHTVTITSAPDIDQTNETDYEVSGTCSGNGSIVDVNVGAVNVQPNCSGLTWTSGPLNVSGEADGPVSVTADHLTATQASTSVTKDTTTPTVSITSAPNIVASNETIYIVSGECSENGVIVTVNIGGTPYTPTCTSGTFTTGQQNVSGLADGPVTITADHSTAPQDTENVTKNTASPSVINFSVATTLSTSVDLDWDLDNPSGNTINDYQFQYRVKGNTTWLTFDDGIDVSTSTTITGLTASTTYEFRARILYDTTLLSDFSAIAEGETQPDDPLFGEYTAMNVGGSTDTNVVAIDDNVSVTLNGGPVNGGTPLTKGQVVNIATSQFDIIDADGAIYTAGRRGAGGNVNKGNITWNPADWAGKSFSFNAIRSNPQHLSIYPVENTTVQVFQGATLLATATFTAGNTTPTSGTNPLTWSVFGSYQVVATGTVLAYHHSNGGTGRVEDPKPLLPAHTEIIGVPGRSMRITTNVDGTNYNYIHGNSTTGSGSINKVAVVNVTGTPNTNQYQENSLIISADQKISGASFADSNGNCAAPFLPTNLMKTRYAINTNADWVAFSSKQAGTIDVLDASDTVVETLTLTRSGANPNAPYKARSTTANATTQGRRFVATVPVAAWYQPDNDGGSADQDETIMYGED